MDAAYILVRLPIVINHRVEEARQALVRLRAGMLSFYREHCGRIAENPHWMLAVAHTFGLLREAFPDELPSRRPYRFDLDRLSMYYCDVIAREFGPE